MKIYQISALRRSANVMSISNWKANAHHLNLYFVSKILIFLISPKKTYHKEMAQSKKEQVITRRGGVGFHDSPQIKQKKGEKTDDKKRLSMTIHDTGD